MRSSDRPALGHRRREALGLRAFVFSIVATLAGCMPNAGARLGETANDYLVHLRFGRVGVLPGYEKPEARAKLAELHAPLGHERQITDVDIVSLTTKDDAGTVIAQVAWYAPGESILRVSSVEQHWVKGAGGTWLVEDESVVAGDPGFFPKKGSDTDAAARGEEKAAPSKGLGKGAHFPTVRIGQ